MKSALELERLVFFSDAVLAIAITLLALELKIENTPTGHLTWNDLRHSGEKFGPFLLSFYAIASFWKIHHEYFANIKKIDNKILTFNILWLLFIVLIPFTTSLISSYSSDTPAMVCFCANILFITFLQYSLWNYVSANPLFLKDNTNIETVKAFKLSSNVGILNALLAIALSFFNPLVAGIMVLFRFPMVFAAQRLLKKRSLHKSKKDPFTFKTIKK